MSLLSLSSSSSVGALSSSDVSEVALGCWDGATRVIRGYADSARMAIALLYHAEAREKLLSALGSPEFKQQLMHAPKEVRQYAEGIFDVTLPLRERVARAAHLSIEGSLLLSGGVTLIRAAVAGTKTATISVAQGLRAMNVGMKAEAAASLYGGLATQIASSSKDLSRHLTGVVGEAKVIHELFRAHPAGRLLSTQLGRNGLDIAFVVPRVSLAGVMLGVEKIVIVECKASVKLIFKTEAQLVGKLKKVVSGARQMDAEWIIGNVAAMAASTEPQLQATARYLVENWLRIAELSVVGVSKDMSTLSLSLPKQLAALQSAANVDSVRQLVIGIGKVTSDPALMASHVTRAHRSALITETLAPLMVSFSSEWQHWLVETALIGIEQRREDATTASAKQILGGQAVQLEAASYTSVNPFRGVSSAESAPAASSKPSAVQLLNELFHSVHAQQHPQSHSSPNMQSP